MLRFALIGAIVLGCSDAGGGMATPDAAPDGLQCVTPASCDDQNTCTTDSVDCSTCQHTPMANCCGNGMVEAGEDCDDGNQQDFDGCSSDCQHELGFVLKTATVLDGTQGCDLTGDGIIDNIFGRNANAPTRQTLSDLLTNQNLATASYVSLWRVRTHDPTLVGPFELSFLLGRDTVPSSTNYFTGQESFYVLPYYLPAAEIAGASPGGVFTAAGAKTIVPMPWIWFTPNHFPLDIRRASYTGTLPNVRLCGAQTAASWHQLPNLLPGAEGATLLDLLVLGAQIVSYRLDPTQPDIDVDGDGLERFADTDGDHRIDLCTDGNGVQIQGTDCPFDPRIADAYSEAFDLEIVPARLAGKAP
jgi:cysteine-rich repeat protein